MTRYIYSLCFYLAQPLVWLRLCWRARKQPQYLQHLAERYGFYKTTSHRPLLWLHAVSVGETRAAEPLIKALLQEFPDHAVLLTHMTPTGRATGQELIAKYGERLIQAYLPYDLPDACGRFFRHFRPAVGLLMETEIWPNLLASAARHQVSVALINARLSAKSAQGYAKLKALIEPALRTFSAIAAQTPADAERLMALGTQTPIITGNLKFDVTPAEDKIQLGKTWKAALGNRPVLLAASTRDGEESLILTAFKQLNRPDILLLVVPRHPQRFPEVRQLIAEHGLAGCQRSDGAMPTAADNVWLGDSMGEMPAYFACADIALIGGTLLPFGGQNLIEAAACGCPVLTGPHTFNFAQATHDALACSAARRIQNAEDALVEAAHLFQAPQTLAAMRQAAIDFSQAHRGATDKTIALVSALLLAKKAD